MELLDISSKVLRKQRHDRLTGYKSVRQAVPIETLPKFAKGVVEKDGVESLAGELTFQRARSGGQHGIVVRHLERIRAELIQVQEFADPAQVSRSAYSPYCTNEDRLTQPWCPRSLSDTLRGRLLSSSRDRHCRRLRSISGSSSVDAFTVRLTIWKLSQGTYRAPSSAASSSNPSIVARCPKPIEGPWTAWTSPSVEVRSDWQKTRRDCLEYRWRSYYDCPMPIDRDFSAL
jgi:hypothetical protein